MSGEVFEEDLKSGLGPRRLPRQQRAKMTVESILQATMELMREEGFSHITTTNIAERAGVNIASVYKYFPNRDSILLSLYEEAATQGAQKLNMLATEIVHDDLDSVVYKILKMLLAHYTDNATVLLRMLHEVPEIREATRAIPFERMINSTIRFYLYQHPEYRSKDTPRHLFFLENLVVGNITRYVGDPPTGVTKSEFLKHLCRIIVAYLKGELS